MTIYAYETTGVFIPSKQNLLINGNQIVTESFLSGYVQVVTRPGAKWGWDITLGDCTPEELAVVEAFITRLDGREHWTTIYDFLRPKPRGTINLSGVTNNGTIAQFATTCNLSGCGNTKTLLRGDWLKLGTQLVMNVTDATSDAGGNMAIEFRHRMRAQVASGQPVVLDGPTSNYILESSNFESIRQEGYAQSGPTFRLGEIF
jgi:hypothetical protein